MKKTFVLINCELGKEDGIISNLKGLEGVNKSHDT